MASLTSYPTYTPSLKIGDVGEGDYSEIKSDGTVRNYGDATAWKDMVGSLLGYRLYSNVGKVDYRYDENALRFSSGGVITNLSDCVVLNLQINHDMLIGSSVTFKPHLHYFQQVTSGAVTPYVFTAYWRLQRNGYAKETSWNTIYANAGTSDDVFDFTSEADGLYNQLLRFDDITVECSISDTFQFRFTRTDSEAGTVDVYFADFHGQCDSQGSKDELVK